MKKIITIIALLSSMFSSAQKVLMEVGSRKALTDTSSKQTGAIAWWGHSMIAGFGLGNVSDSNIVNVYKNISGYYGYNLGVSGETSTQILTRFLASPQYYTVPSIFWIVRNSPDSATDVGNQKRMIDTLIKYNTPYIIINALNRTDEGKATGGFTLIKRINQGFTDNFPGKVFDVFRFIRNSYNPSLPADVTAFNDSVPPPSLMNDPIHLNGIGYRLVAQKIYSDLHSLITGDKIASEVSFRQFFKAPRLNTDNNNLLIGSKFNLQNGNIGLSSTSMTHPLTIGNAVGNKGIRIFNTTDEITNTERVDINFNGTFFQIASSQTGTGTARPFRVSVPGGINFDVGAVVSGLQKGAVSFNATLFGGNSSIGGVYGDLGSFQNNNGFAIVPTINKVDGAVPGSAQMLWISPYKQSTSGPLGKNMIRAGWNSAVRGTGTDTAYWILDSTGNVLANGGAFFGADKVVGMTANPVRDASAFVQMNSTTQGLLIPRMTASQRGAISSPAQGLLVYQTDSPAGFYVYNGGWALMGDVYTSSGGVTKTGTNFTNDLITATSGSKTAYGGTGASDILNLQGTTNTSPALGSNLILKTSGSVPLDAVYVNNNGVVKLRDFALGLIELGGTTPYTVVEGNGSEYAYSGSGVTMSLPTTPTIAGWTITISNVGSGNITVNVVGGAAKLFDTSAVTSVSIGVGGSRTFTWYPVAAVYKVK